MRTRSTLSLATKSLIVVALGLPQFGFASASPPSAPPPLSSASPPPSESSSRPKAEGDNDQLSVFAEKTADVSGKSSKLKNPPKSPALDPKVPGSEAGSTEPIKVKNPPKNKKVEVETRTCNNGIRQCQAAQQACTTVGGGHSAAPAQVTWVRVDGGAWQVGTVSCGPPTAVEVPETNSTLR